MQVPEWRFDEPRWQDSGRRVAVRLASNSIVTGTLWSDDPLGARDAHPTFNIEGDDGRIYDFAEHAGWRFADGT